MLFPAKQLYTFLPPIIWAVFILVICLIPAREIPSVSIFEFDKIVHAACYFILAGLSFRSMHQAGRERFRSLIVLWLLLVFYGFGVEVAQEVFTTDRHFDIMDAIANTFGVLLFIIVKLIFR